MQANVDFSKITKIRCLADSSQSSMSRSSRGVCRPFGCSALRRLCAAAGELFPTGKCCHLAAIGSSLTVPRCAASRPLGSPKNTAHCGLFAFSSPAATCCHLTDFRSTLLLWINKLLLLLHTHEPHENTFYFVSPESVIFRQ